VNCGARILLKGQCVKCARMLCQDEVCAIPRGISPGRTAVPRLPRRDVTNVTLFLFRIESLRKSWLYKPLFGNMLSDSRDACRRCRICCAQHRKRVAKPASIDAPFAAKVPRPAPQPASPAR
jgi:hypothetical protein